MLKQYNIDFRTYVQCGYITEQKGEKYGENERDNINKFGKINFISLNLIYILCFVDKKKMYSVFIVFSFLE